MDEPEGTKTSAVKDRQVALGALYKQSLTKKWLYWMDSMRAFKVDADNFKSVHFEIRTKF